jgi:hypothetical protein
LSRPQDISELKELVRFYPGDKFDEKSFLEFWDVGKGGVVTLDVSEFGWYLTHWADGQNSKMPEVIRNFNDAIEHRRNLSAAMKNLHAKR